MSRHHLRIGELTFTLVWSVVLAPPGATNPVATPEPDAPESYASRLCDTPQNLTGAMRLLAQTGSSQPSVVWDGSAYGVACFASPAISFARVAADGTSLLPPRNIPATGYLNPSIVWTGTDYALTGDNNTDVYFIRISAAGIKTTGDVQVSTTAAGFANYSNVVWTGSQFGVAWQDYRDGSSEIYFRRVDAASAPMGASDSRITSDPAASELPSVAYNGLAYGVAWYDTRYGNAEILAALVSTSTGAKIGADVRVTTDPGQSYDPSLAWDGAAFGLAWEDSRTTVYDIYFARLDASLAKIGSDVQITSNASTSYYPSLAWTGSEHGVVWLDNRDGNYEVYFARISQAGVKQGGDQRLTYDPASTVPSYGRRVLAFGTLGYGLVYQVPGSPIDSIDFIGIGCHDDATPPSCPNGLAVTGNSSASVTLGWAAPGRDLETELAYHKVYRDGLPVGITTIASFTDAPRPAGSPMYTVQAVNAAGMESTGCAVVTAPEPTGDCGEDWTGSQIVTVTTLSFDQPAVDWDGEAYGVLWDDGRNGDRDIYFRRMAAAGVPLTADVRITTAVGNSYSPRLAWTGSFLGMTWRDDRDGSIEIYFNRVSKLGAPLGSDLRVTNDASTSDNPSLSWTGTEFGVVWYDTRDGNSEIYFNRISASGSLIGVDLRVTSDPSTSLSPSLVWTGTEYGVSWHDSRDGNSEIYFSRISASGSVIGADVRVTTNASWSQSPSLVWTGTEYGVSWHDNRDGNYEIYFNRISASGSVIGADVRVTTNANLSLSPSLVWTGTEHAISWYDLRNGNDEIYVATLDATGVKVGGDRRLTASILSDRYPALVMGGRGLGLAYGVETSQDQTRFIGLGCGPVDTTPPTCPASPVELWRSSGNPGTVALGWGPSFEPDSDLSHYRILRDGVEVGVTTELTYSDTTFNPTAGYTYWIDAVNAAGYESYGCASVDTTDTVPPTCPTNLLATVVPSPLSITITWLPAADARSGLRSYLVYRDNVFQTYVTAPTTSYTDSTIAAGTTYNYAILAGDWAGNVSQGCGSTSTIYVATAPITLYLTKQGNGIDAHLDWNDVGLNEYVVYRSTSPQTATEHARVPVSQDDDPVLTDGVTWYYYIQQRGM